ncbi:MAG: hypothetical protein HZY79_13900 [Rhodoblastus sp.]|nr:MAG: hypothetical protein HZY79_13900 [Rhodoblastus sp.]
MNFRVMLRVMIAAAIGFGIGMAAQAKSTPAAAAHEPPAKIAAPAR